MSLPPYFLLSLKQNMVKEKLMFPGHHFGIELECGTDIVQCNLSDT